jgi:hypothetical protein
MKEFIGGLVVGITASGLLTYAWTDVMWQRDLVRRGFAYYYVDPNIGGCSRLHYKASTWDQILEGGYVEPQKNLSDKP